MPTDTTATTTHLDAAQLSLLEALEELSAADHPFADELAAKVKDALGYYVRSRQPNAFQAAWRLPAGDIEGFRAFDEAQRALADIESESEFAEDDRYLAAADADRDCREGA